MEEEIVAVKREECAAAPAEREPKGSDFRIRAPICEWALRPLAIC